MPDDDRLASAPVQRGRIVMGTRFRQTRTGWKTINVDAILFVAGACTLILGILPFLSSLIDFVCWGNEESLDIAAVTGYILLGGVASLALGFAINAWAKKCGRIVEAPAMWAGLPKSSADSLAPLERERISLEKQVLDGTNILNDLPADSTNRKLMQSGIDELSIKVEAVKSQIGREVEMCRKMSEIDAKTRNELATEARADKWLD